MYQFLIKNGLAVAFGFGVLLTIIFLLIALPGAGDYDFTNMDDAQMTTIGIFDFGLWAAIILTVIAALALIVFGIMQVASHPKASMKGLIGFGALILLFIITYAMASGEPETALLTRSVQNFESSQETDITPSDLKLIGGGIITSLVLMGIAVVVLIVTGVRNFFK